MISKRALRKQQDNSLAGKRWPAAAKPWSGSARGSSATRSAITHAVAPAIAAGDRLEHLSKLAVDLHMAMNQCARAAGAEAVHRVRTGSRRVQALVETMMGDPGSGGSAFDRAAGRWLGQLRRMRRAAGPVRDLDVHRLLLQNWSKGALAREDRGTESTRADRGPAGGSASTVDELRRQTALLDDWLKAARQPLAQALKHQVQRRIKKAAAREIATFAAARELVPSSRTGKPPLAKVLEDFVRIADATPLLDSGNLHDFRKEIKKLRYRTESLGQEQSARAVAKALKQLQDAIGRWHDWLTLTEEAKTALRDEGPGLAVRFEAEVERQFSQAIETVQVVRGGLLGEWLALKGHSLQALLRRIQPASSQPASIKAASMKAAKKAEPLPPRPADDPRAKHRSGSAERGAA